MRQNCSSVASGTPSTPGVSEASPRVCGSSANPPTATECAGVRYPEMPIKCRCRALPSASSRAAMIGSWLTRCSWRPDAWKKSNSPPCATNGVLTQPLAGRDRPARGERCRRRRRARRGTCCSQAPSVFCSASSADRTGVAVAPTGDLESSLATIDSLSVATASRSESTAAVERRRRAWTSVPKLDRSPGLDRSPRCSSSTRRYGVVLLRRSLIAVGRVYRAR